MSAGEHEMRDYHTPQDAPRPTINQTPNFKPYLGLRARLSQIWLNRWTILLLLVLVRLMFAASSTDASLVSARREALSACNSVEKLGSSMASMPHYMSKGVNEMTATSVEKAVNGLMKMLEMSVKGVEEIALFVLHMYIDMYLCLFHLVVTGSTKLALDLVKKVTAELDKATDDVAKGVGDSLGGVANAINDIIKKVNNPFMNLKIPTIDVDGTVNKIKAINFPDDAVKQIEGLEKKIPNFDKLKDTVDGLIRKPFDMVEGLIKNKTGTYKFDRSLLPVPQKESLNFCTEGNSIGGFFDDLTDMVSKGRTIAIAILVAAAILVIAPMAWQEIRRYRRMQERAALFEAQGTDPMDVVYLASRPTTSTAGLWFSKRFGSAHRAAVIRWAWAYATSTPMLFVLSVAAAGLFSCLCQYILLKAIKDKAPEITEQVADFAGKVVRSVDNASVSWAIGVNGVVAQTNTKINQEVFGWVNDTTGAINNTINTFQSEISKVINTAFGDTPLKEPVEGLVRCIIGLKLEGVQKGITWISNNAQVNFPGVRNDTFSLGALADKSGSESGAELLADPSGKAKDEISEAVNHVIEKMSSGIQQEAMISATLLIIWILVALAGYIYAGVHFFRRDPYAARAYNINQDLDAANEPKPNDFDAAAPPSYVANDYNVNKAAPYTLTQRPMPTYDVDDPGDEKVGQVNARDITTSSRPGHLRASSHGDLADPSPLDERNPDNLFSDANHNPFTDRYGYPREK